MSRWLVLFGMIAVAAPASAEQPPPIVGGVSAGIGQFPATVYITVTTGSDTGAECTGTLIAPDWVLTAAHCVDAAQLGLATQDAVAAGTTVHAGIVTTDDPPHPGITVGASASLPNPDYDPSMIGVQDSGLIQLAQPITTIAPVTLGFDPTLAPAGVQATTVGFGFEHDGDQYLVVHTSESCAPLGFDDTEDLCFSQFVPDFGTGPGDSGGPSFAVIRGRLVEIGITSFAASGSDYAYAGMARVAAAAPFILQTIPALDCTQQMCPGDLMCDNGTCLAATCEHDSDCAADQSCVDGGCAKQSGSPGGLGAACSTSDDCDSADCLVLGSDSQCVVPCDVAGSDGSAGSCPSNFTCIAVMNAGAPDVGVCQSSMPPPPSEGGNGCCEASGSRASMLVGIALIGMHRRRRTRP